MNPLSPEGQAASLAKMKRYANGKYGDANAKPGDNVLINGVPVPAKTVHEINELWAGVVNDDHYSNRWPYVGGTAHAADFVGTSTVAQWTAAPFDQLAYEEACDLAAARIRERRWYRRLYRWLMIWVLA
jgi:hypothetical protein